MPSQIFILIVEDEPVISNFIAEILLANDYNVLKAVNGKQAIAMTTSYCPDLVLLDLGLPDIDGLEVLTKIHRFSDTPVIVVSARGHEREKVEALDLGADDYVTKPFGTSELLARIRTALRHRQQLQHRAEPEKEVTSIKGLEIDHRKRIVLVDGKDVHLTPIEYKIILLLSRHAGKVLTYDFIIKEIWGPYISDNQILRVNMANIRRKIEHNLAEPVYILTDVGVGYRMIEAD